MGQRLYMHSITAAVHVAAKPKLSAYRAAFVKHPDKALVNSVCTNKLESMLLVPSPTLLRKLGLFTGIKGKPF